MKCKKTSLKVVSFSISLIFTMSAVAGSGQKPNELKRMLTIGISPSSALEERADGLYRTDNGTAAVISEPNYQSSNGPLLNSLKNKEINKKAFITIALDYLKINSSKFGLEKNSIETLFITSTRFNNDFSVIRFEQHSNGLPVYGSSIAVTVRNDGRVTFVASNTVTGLENLTNKFNAVQTIDKQQAIERAKSHLGSTELSFSKADLSVYKALDGSVYEVWRVRAIPTSEPRGDWEILIDTATGMIHRAEDKQRHAIGSANVYKADPLTTTAHKYGDKGYADNKDKINSSDPSQMPTDTPELTAARTKVVLKDISFSNNRYSLSSSYAVCDDFESPKDNACPVQQSADFNFTRTSKYFDAVNAFYAIDTYLRYVNETLEVKAMPYQYQGGVHFDPHGVQGDDNSHYSESTGTIAFGQGGVDDAEDVTVVIHELGHGLHDWLTNGNAENDDRNGLGEGTGDYLAAGYIRDLQENKWKPNDPQYNWVMLWDGHNPFWPGRITNWNVGRKYPDDVVNTGDSHTAGQYWSSCNLIARGKLGGKEMDKVFFNGLSKTIETTDQLGAAQAIIDAARDMGYSQEKINNIAYAYNTACTYGVKVPKANSEGIYLSTTNRTW